MERLTFRRGTAPPPPLPHTPADQPEPTRQLIIQFEELKNTERLICLSEQGIAAIYLVFFDLPDNLTVAHDPSEQLCYGRRRQSHASDGRHRCQHPSTFALTRPRECQRHYEGSTPPTRATPLIPIRMHSTKIDTNKNHPREGN